MKRKLSVVLLLATAMILIMACGKEEAAEKKEKPLKLSANIEIVLLKGSETAKPLENLSSSYKIKEMETTEELSAKLLSGEFDMAVTSPNEGAILNKESGGQIVVLSPTKLDTLYVVSEDYVEEDYIKPIKYLNNRTINVLGEKSTSEYVLNKVMEDNYIYGTDINYVKSESELKEAMEEYGSVGVVTKGQKENLLKDTDVKEVINLSEEWEKATNQKIITEVILVSKTFKEKRGEDIEVFISDYEKLLDKKESGTVFYGSSNRGENLLKNFYKAMFDFDQESVGGSMPEENFYN